MSFFEAIIMGKFAGDEFGHLDVDKSGVKTPHSKTLSRLPYASLIIQELERKFEVPFASITWSRFDGSPALPRRTLSHLGRLPCPQNATAGLLCQGGRGGWFLGETAHPYPKGP